ncbi:hypothetical protein D5S17_11100 [Pseudonocardiaceae bacterium YIM PH 21723]|nr:hypothetical protein D5S17_11100 [Pseudonocardiaceae bacterium YIM PH 21723]
MEVVGFVLALKGVAGLIREYFGWLNLWNFERWIPLLRDHALAVNITCVAVGVAVMIASDKVRESA